MKKSYIIVEHRNSAAFNRLLQQVEALKQENNDLRRRYVDLEYNYGNEVFFNNALCDLLRDNGIPFREIFSNEYRKNC